MIGWLLFVAGVAVLAVLAVKVWQWGDPEIPLDDEEDQ